MFNFYRKNTLQGKQLFKRPLCFHEPLAFFVEQGYRFAADAADVTYAHPARFQRSGAPHVQHPVNGEDAPIFPDDGRGANGSVYIKFRIDLQIDFHFTR